MSLCPLFVAGCDRSGTTMLGDMLGTAPAAFATPESQWLHDLLLMLHVGAFDTPLAAARWLCRQFRFAAWDLPHDAAALAGFIDLGDPRASVEAIIGAYLDTHAPARAAARIWVDHTPDSFKHYALLSGYFPEARYIHIVRDGRAVFSSIKALPWGPNNAYMGTRFWTARVRQALGVEAGAGARCRRVRYEDVLANPATELGALCDWAGLRFAPEMLRGGGVVLPAFTRSQHRLVGRPPDASRATEWRRCMSPVEIREFESYAWSRTLLQRFGYALETAHPARIPTPVVLMRYAHDLGRYGLNRARHRRIEARTLAAAERGGG